MSINRYFIAAGLATMLLSSPGRAGIAAGSPGDCAVARDPLRCLALQKARSACKAKRGQSRQKCIQQQMAAPDCPPGRDQVRCEERQLTREACGGKTGEAKRICQRELGLALGNRGPTKQ